MCSPTSWSRSTWIADGLIIAAIDRASGRNAIVEGAHGNLLQLHQDFPNMWDAWDVDRFYRNTVTDLRAWIGSSRSCDSDGARLVVERRFSALTDPPDPESGAGGAGAADRAGGGLARDGEVPQGGVPIRDPCRAHGGRDAVRVLSAGHPHQHDLGGRQVRDFDAPLRACRRARFRRRLITDSTYGYDVSRDASAANVTTCVRLALLRAPRFPDPETDQGSHVHRFGMVIGAGVAEATVAGALLNTAERPATGSHGFLPLVSVTGEGVVVTSVKLAADRSGDLVVRVYESLGRRANGQLRIDPPVGAPRWVSLLEEEPDEAAAGEHASDGAVPLALTPFEVPPCVSRHPAERLLSGDGYSDKARGSPIPAIPRPVRTWDAPACAAARPSRQAREERAFRDCQVSSPLNRPTTLAFAAVLGVSAFLVPTTSSTAAPQPAAPPPAAPPPVAWGACAEGDLAGVPPAELSQFSCATYAVPLDHDRPRRGTISIALMQSGGGRPGHAGSARCSSTPAVPEGVVSPPGALRREHSSQPQVLDRFDLIGFDPRGVARSTPLRCFITDEEAAEVFGRMIPLARDCGGGDRQLPPGIPGTTGTSCDSVAGPLIEHMSTKDVARDLDLLRAAVGDEKLTYVGFSYGTLLGATYANLFPKRTRALVLDGNVDPRLRLHRRR